MKKYVREIAVALMIGVGFSLAQEKILIIKDELPQMQLLADYMQKAGGFTAELADQNRLPASLHPYRSVVLYVHRQLTEETELAVIKYTRQGGRLLVLHHSISSGKRNNRYWFDFLKIKLPEASLQDGGYAYRDPVDVQMVNLRPDHYITSHNLTWPEKTTYGDVSPIEAPAVTLHHSEAYLNQKFTDQNEKLVLCGMKYFDSATGVWYMQDQAAWLKKADQGWIFYLMFGHKNNDFEVPQITQMILNAMTWQP